MTNEPQIDSVDAETLRRCATAVRNLITQSNGAGDWARWVPRQLLALAERMDPGDE